MKPQGISSFTSRQRRKTDYLTCLKVIGSVVNMNSVQPYLIFEWPLGKANV